MHKIMHKIRRDLVTHDTTCRLFVSPRHQRLRCIGSVSGWMRATLAHTLVIGWRGKARSTRSGRVDRGIRRLTRHPSHRRWIATSPAQHRRPGARAHHPTVRSQSDNERISNTPKTMGQMTENENAKSNEQSYHAASCDSRSACGWGRRATKGQ